MSIYNKRPCIIDMTIANGELGSLGSVAADGCGLASKQSGVKSSAGAESLALQELTQA